MIHEEMYRYLRRVRSRSEVAMLSLLMPFLLAYMGSSRSHELDECPISGKLIVSTTVISNKKSVW